MDAFLAEHEQTLAPLVDIYGELFNTHAVTGLSHEAAIPLFMTALTFDSGAKRMRADTPSEPPSLEGSAPHGFLRGKTAAQGEDTENYQAFREAMVPASERRALQYFSTNRGLNFCMNGGYINSYTTRWSPWNDPRGPCCGTVCGNVATDRCDGTCGSYSPDCSNDCDGMCGPSCNECWPGICGDCCLWKGCWQHDYDCDCTFSFACPSCIGRTIQAVENQVESFSSRQSWCLDGYREPTGSGH